MRAALVSALLLAGCAMPFDGASEQGAAPDADGLFLSSSGLQPAGTPLRIDFGRAQSGVISAVSRLLGAPPEGQSANRECGAGPVTVVSYDGLDLLFRNGDFRGWVADGAGLSTGSGLSVGQSREDLVASRVTAFEETARGTEFSASGVDGLLDESGQAVRMLRAGTSCFFW